VKPKANTSPEAVTLRECAHAFAKQGEPRDASDVKGQRLNRDLLAAAIAYARVADPLYRQAGVVLSEIDRGLVDGSLLDNGVLEYLDENVRALVCKLLGHKTRCGDTDVCLERQEAEGIR
jgi:hypothetical protein